MASPSSPSQADISTDSGDNPDNPIEHPVSDVHINGAPTCVQWIDGDTQQERCVCHHTRDQLWFYAQYEASSGTALLQLQARLALKAQKDKAYIFLSIYPERVQSVELVAHGGGDDTASTKLGTSTHCLQFILSTPPDLVVPKGDLTPRQQRSGLVLDSLKGLTSQRTFKLYLPTTTLPKLQLKSFCNALSSGALYSTEKLRDVASLYRGEGGRIIRQKSQPAVISNATSAAAAPDGPESLPSYDELVGGADSAQPSTNQKSGTKRRRTSSSAGWSGIPGSHKCVVLDVQTLSSKVIERIDEGFDRLFSRMDHLDVRISNLETCVHSWAEKLEHTIATSQQHASKQADELRDELERGLIDIRNETDDIVATRVEDEVYLARQDLDDHVRDEMAEVEERVEERMEERIMQRLSNASMNLEFNWGRES